MVNRRRQSAPMLKAAQVDWSYWDTEDKWTGYSGNVDTGRRLMSDGRTKRRMCVQVQVDGVRLSGGGRWTFKADYQLDWTDCCFGFGL